MTLDLSMGREGVRLGLAAFVASSRTPGIQYLVVAPDGVVFEHASGWADLSTREPMRPTTPMMAYSMTKSVTAATVLQLADLGKVSLDDPIDRYVDALPYGPQVTIRQLLSHTSGLPNPIPLRWVHPVSREDAFDERHELARIIRRHGALTSPPGAKYRYSNLGYWLLGPVVEHATGEAFESYVAEHVLQRLGIAHADLGFQMTEPRCASGYLEAFSLVNLVKPFLVDRALIGQYAGRWLHILAHRVNGLAFGGLIGTARGFGRFLQDLLRPQSVLFSDDTRRAFFAPSRTRSGAPIPVTLGWHVGGGACGRHFFKEGGGAGFRCMMRVYPDRARATVVMTNATVFNVGRVLDALDPSFLT